MTTNTLGILSAVTTAGLLIAWGITAGVISGNRASRNREKQERDAILEPIIGREKLANLKIHDAIKEGRMTQSDAMILQAAFEKSAAGSNSGKSVLADATNNHAASLGGGNVFGIGMK